MSPTEEEAKAKTANASAPTEGSGPAPSPPSTGSTGGGTPRREPRGWGDAARPEDWVKLRSLLGATYDGRIEDGGKLVSSTGRTLRVTRISTATITPETGAGAGVARESFVLELDDGHLFSVNKTDSIGGQLTGFGIPTLPFVCHVVSQPSGKSQTGDSLMLKRGPCPPATAPKA